jgi:glycerol-3-phosphate acyltransferase PlsY
LGSASTSYFITRKLFKKDLDKIGSGNLGTMNTVRNIGKLPGLIVFVLDVAKGMLSVYLCLRYNINPLWGLTGVVAGHNFSIFLGFRGGKGLASAFGAILLMNLTVFSLIAAFGILFVAATRNIYIASVAMAGAFPLTIAYVFKDVESILLSILVSAFIIYRHKKDFIKK